MLGSVAAVAFAQHGILVAAATWATAQESPLGAGREDL